MREQSYRVRRIEPARPGRELEAFVCATPRGDYQIEAESAQQALAVAREMAERDMEADAYLARRTAMRERPMLSCPECGVDLIPAHGRGRTDDDGNDIEHRDACRCRWCDWWWHDDHTPVDCACGARVRVETDDGHAYAVAVPREEVRDGA